MNDYVLDPHLLAMPTYSPGNTEKEYQEQFGLDSILNLASSVNRLGPSSQTIQAIQQASQSVKTYPGNDLSQLRNNIAKFVDPGLKEENIIVGNGSCDILRMAAEVFLYGGGEAIVRRNAFPMYEVLVKRFGGKCVFVETNPDYSFDVLAVAERITDRTKLIFLANPHNPTGMIIPQDDLDEFMTRIPPSVIVVFDHACQDYVEDRNFPNIPKYILEGHNIIMTRTFSKIFGLPGLRVGYGVASKEIIDVLRRTKIPFYNNSISMIAASAALDDAEHVELSRATNHDGKKFLYQQFEQMALSFLPTQSNSILLTDFEQDTEYIRDKLLCQSILILPAHPYRFPNAIRVTIGQPEENLRLIRALKHLL